MSLLEIMQGPDGHFDMLRLLEPEALAEVESQIGLGALPPDTMFRLDSLGDNTPMPGSEPEVRARSQRWDIILQLAGHGPNLDKLSPLARRVVFGGPLKAMLVWNPEPEAKRLHTEFDPPFLIRKDLAEIIRERRIREGKTITEVPDDRRWRPPEQVEFMQYYRLSHGLWRALANRITPEYLQTDDLRHYYRPRKRTRKDGFGLDEGESDVIVRREIVSAIVFNIAHIKNIYDEATSTGVRGIGPVGRQDLRSLLDEEYLELK